MRAMRALAAISLAAACTSCGLLRSEIEIAGVGRLVETPDGANLVAFELVQRGKRPDPEGARGTLLYVQGSEYASVAPAVERLAGAVVLGLRVVLAERRGVDAKGQVDLDAAHAGATKPKRVADVRAVLSSYLADAPRGRPVVLVGSSEGGDVAAAVAAAEPRVTHLVLLGSGGGWSQAEEFRHLLGRRGEFLGLRSEAGLEEAFRRVRERPDSTELWAGHPHRRWSTFLWSPPKDDLLKLEIPIFLAHGAADASVPVESARALVAAFAERGKTNLEYREYEGLDHSFADPRTGRSGFPRLELDLVRWFAGQGLLPAEHAAEFESRVRRAHPDLEEDSRR